MTELIYAKADALDVIIEQLEIMPYHVHIFVKSDPTCAPHCIVGQLKGYTSRILHKEFPILRSRLPSLWTRSYYVESCGHISKDTVRRYIADQKHR